MTAWTWGRRDVVRIVVTAVDAYGKKRRWYRDLRAGRDEAETIALPDGTETVTIERPVRRRVELGRRRAVSDLRVEGKTRA